MRGGSLPWLPAMTVAEYIGQVWYDEGRVEGEDATLEVVANCRAWPSQPVTNRLDTIYRSGLIN